MLCQTMIHHEFSESCQPQRVSTGSVSGHVEFPHLLHNYQMGILEAPPWPLRLFITGGAGTGKSHVISVIREHLERTHLGAGKRCILMAPTGVAAFNICGLTIHRALNLPVEHSRSTRYCKLSADKLDMLRRDWRNVDTVVIDEISMVSYQTLYFSTGD